MKVSQYSEDALKHLYKAEYQGGAATLESLAGQIGKGQEECSQILSFLKKDGFAESKGVRWFLTSRGTQRALELIRAHRLYETWLAEQTGEDSRNWHELAEAMEHKLTPEQANDLARKLGHPRFDPHGDPIPTQAGSIASPRGILLSECKQGFEGKIDHVEDEPAAIYSKIVEAGLAPGMRLRVLNAEEDSFMVNVEGRTQKIKHAWTCNISLTLLDEEDHHFYQRLSDLKKGEKAQIKGISSVCLGPERRRLLDLGVVPGSVVSIDLQGAFRSPIAYRIRGTVIALRLEQAEQILIQKEEISS